MSSVKVFSNIGKGIKYPLFGELFGSAFTDGNPALRPERARTVDGGAELTFAGQRWRTSVTHFRNQYRDQVAFRFSGRGGDGQPDYVNIAGSAANGWEVEGVLQRPIAGVPTSPTTFPVASVQVDFEQSAYFLLVRQYTIPMLYLNFPNSKQRG